MPDPKRKKKEDPASSRPAPESDFDSAFSGFNDYQPASDNPLAKPSEPKEEPKAKPEPMSKLRKASKTTTQSKTQNIDVGDIGQEHISDLIINTGIDGYIDDVDETGLIPYDQVDTRNLPAQVSTSLSKDGVNPEFHQVSSLPGNMIRAINVLGKQLFSSLTSTPTKDVYVVANLGGQGPNLDGEVNAVANYVVKHGKAVSEDGTVNFDKIMPGYEAKISEYSLDGVRYLLVKDDMGKYVYAWPDKDSATKLDQGDERLALPASSPAFLGYTGEANISADPAAYGVTPNNVDIDYLGVRVEMTPSMFLALASPLNGEGKSTDFFKGVLQSGGYIAAPTLYILVPDAWRNGDLSEEAKVSGHEGRNRMTAILNVEGNVPVEVHILLKSRNAEWRNRHITPEIMDRLSEDIINEVGVVIHGPLFIISETMTEAAVDLFVESAM
jgi:hypothetical protein